MMDQKTIKIGFLMVFAVLMLSSCYYDVEEELYGTTTCDTDNMSYQNDILPIITTNCYGCHDSQSNFGNVNVEGYDQLLIYVNNGALLGTIRHDSGFSAMPLNASKLLDCNIEKVESWVADGAPDN